MGILYLKLAWLSVTIFFKEIPLKPLILLAFLKDLGSFSS